MGRTACTEPQCLYNGALYIFYVLYEHTDITAEVLLTALFKLK